MESTPKEGTPNQTKCHRSFAIIFVLGAPGAGKGTLSTHLARAYNLAHYSVGDSLRLWMHNNRSTPLAREIQSKLDNQGFLKSEDLYPFIYLAILDAINRDEPKLKGILVDGFPRCTEQLDAPGAWPFQDKAPLAHGIDGETVWRVKPDIVLSFNVAKPNAKARYLGRARDANDSEGKFEKRFAEYERETKPVEELYRQRGILIDIDANGTKGDNIDILAKKLKDSELWQDLVTKGNAGMQLLI